MTSETFERILRAFARRTSDESSLRRLGLFLFNSSRERQRRQNREGGDGDACNAHQRLLAKLVEAVARRPRRQYSERGYASILGGLVSPV